MKKTEESLRRLKKGKKSAFSFLGSSGARDDDGRADEERIRAQMVLDVEAFGKEAESLGVATGENETYKILEEMARASLTDGTLPPVSSRSEKDSRWGRILIRCPYYIDARTITPDPMP